MTPALDLPVAPPTSPAPTSQTIATALVFRQKEAVLAGYLAAFAVVHYRLPAERAPAQLTATLHIETAATAFPPATVTLQLADDLTLADVAAEAAARLPMALAGVADELGAAIVRGRLALPALEAQNPDQTWELTIGFGAPPDEAATLSFGSPGGAAAPRDTAYLAEHVQAVFAQLAQNPAVLVGHVFFLAEVEVAQLRQFRVGPALEAAGGPTLLHQLFEETARTYPNHVALSWLGQLCTYRELDGRADQLAAHLRQQGVQTGDFVGLFMAKSVELYVGMLAVLKAGATYVPLDLSFPPDRVAFILGDCGARALLINNNLPEGLATWPGQVLDLRQPMPTAPVFQEPVAAGPDSIAYVIYTSGTTGLVPSLSYSHRSGLYSTVNGYYFQQSQPPHYAFTDLELGYANNFTAAWTYSLSYDQVFFTPPLSATDKLIPNGLEAYSAYQLGPLQAAVDYSFYFGKSSTQTITLALSRAFKKDDWLGFATINLTPEAQVLWGSPLALPLRAERGALAYTLAGHYIVPRRTTDDPATPLPTGAYYEFAIRFHFLKVALNYANRCKIFHLKYK